MVIAHIAQRLGIGHVLDGLVKCGQLRCGGFAHFRDGQREEPAREGKSFGPIDRLNGLGGVLLPEDTRIFFRAEIERRQRVDL